MLELSSWDRMRVYLSVVKTKETLYAFDLTADLGEDNHFSLVRQGSVRLVLKFAQALPATVTVIAYAEFKNVIEIDRNKNVVFEYRV